MCVEPDPSYNALPVTMAPMIRSLVSCALAGLACVCCAQTLRPELNTLAIVGARIEVKPGQVVEKGTVLVRNGLIVEVGQNVKVPAGSEIIDGTGLFVYAGFVDCGTTKGLRKAPDRPRQNEVFDPSTDFATTMRWESPTIRPDLSAADLFDPDDAAWKEERKAGFTTALVYPAGGVIKGQAALVDTDGRARRTSVVADSLALAMDFTGGGDPYPGTPLGSFAVVRQAFLDADWMKNASKSYARVGAPRPPDDPCLEALSKLRGLPAVFDADAIWKIDSVVSFAKELGLRPIVLGAKEAYKRNGCLDGASAILKMDFAPEPFPKKDEKEKEKEKEKEGDKDKEELAPEPDAKKAERQRIWLEGVRNAKTLFDSGIPFALSTQGCKSQDAFFENLRRAVKEGLPREAALAALTVNPSSLFGLDKSLGTVEPGKIANLTVMTLDFIDPKAKVKILVVDGIKVDPSKEQFKPDNAPPQFGDGGGQ